MLGTTLKRALREWTGHLVGEDAEERFRALERPQNEFGVDPFGFNLEWTLSAVAPLVWLYKHYFRVETHDIERVPPGRVLLVSNHSGQLPVDAVMIAIALLVEGTSPRAVRSMVEKWVPSLPYVSSFMARLGQIVGTPENCRRLLAAGDSILVFPEGVRGITKLWPQRYQLQDFGLGFMRLALETDTPVVPIGVVGAEEQAPALLDLKPLARLLGFPAFPVTVTGLPIPLPTKYRIYFGEPLHFSGRPDDEDAELERKVRVVRSGVQELLNHGLKERQHVFW
jgi:1-acyl-sn-glycerol-3-phosphate acyltransferase